MQKTHFVGLFIFSAVSVFGQQPERVYRAIARLQGAPGSNISGIVTFTQAGTNTGPNILPTVLVEAAVTGLKAGEIRGIHIHEFANCGNTNLATNATGAFTGAGGHYSPGPKGDSNPDNNHPFHMGDLPNLVVDDNNVGTMRHRTSRVTLTDGPLSLFKPADFGAFPTFDSSGTSVILHAGTDQGTTGVAGGAGGGRVACGVIERVSGFDDLVAPSAAASKQKASN